MLRSCLRLICQNLRVSGTKFSSNYNILNPYHNVATFSRSDDQPAFYAGIIYSVAKIGDSGGEGYEIQRKIF